MENNIQLVKKLTKQIEIADKAMGIVGFVIEESNAPAHLQDQVLQFGFFGNELNALMMAAALQEVVKYKSKKEKELKNLLKEDNERPEQRKIEGKDPAN
jgi:hypothetical protein